MYHVVASNQDPKTIFVLSEFVSDKTKIIKCATWDLACSFFELLFILSEFRKMQQRAETTWHVYFKLHSWSFSSSRLSCLPLIGLSFIAFNPYPSIYSSVLHTDLLGCRELQKTIPARTGQQAGPSLSQR